MRKRNQHIIDDYHQVQSETLAAWIAAGLLTIIILCLVHRALAQDLPADHSAFSAHGVSSFSLEYDTLDIAKLEAKAVAVLREKSGLTLAEARGQVRVDGRTDVARCIEIIVPNHLKSITQATVIATVIGHQHPEPQ